MCRHCHCSRPSTTAPSRQQAEDGHTLHDVVFRRACATRSPAVGWEAHTGDRANGLCEGNPCRLPFFPAAESVKLGTRHDPGAGVGGCPGAVVPVRPARPLPGPSRRRRDTTPGRAGGRASAVHPSERSPRPGSTGRRKPAIPQRKHSHDGQRRGCDAQPRDSAGSAGAARRQCYPEYGRSVTKSSGDPLRELAAMTEWSFETTSILLSGGDGAVQGGIRWTGRCRSRC